MNPGNHPTGIAGALTAVLLLVLRQVGLHIDGDAAIAVGGLVTLIVSLLTPRVTHLTTILLSPEAKHEDEK